MTLAHEKRTTIGAADEFIPQEDHSVASANSFDKDLASALVPEYAQEIDPATESNVLHKLDLWIIPWMWVGYGFVYYDKVQ